MKKITKIARASKIGIAMAIFLIMLCSCSARGVTNSKENNTSTSQDLALYEAIDHNNLEEINEALSKGANINEIKKGSKKINPYTFALEENLKQVAIYLISKGADVNYTDSKGTSLLMKTVQENQGDLCVLLLEKGADIKQEDHKGYTALEYVCEIKRGTEKETEDMIQFLLEQGARVTSQTLDVAIKYFEEEDPYLNISYKSIKLLLQDLKENQEKSTLPPILEYAILGDNEKVVGLLQSEELSKTMEQELVFFTAAFGKTSTLIELEKKGINLEQTDKHKNTPLHIAAQCGNIETLAYLITSNKDKGEAFIEGEGPLNKAILAGQYETTSYLLAQGMKIEAAMYEQAAKTNQEILELLISYQQPTKRELNYCLAEAINSKQFGSCELLIKNGADVDFEGDNFSILEQACQNDNLEGVQFLIKNGAKVDGPEGEGRPLRASIQYGSYALTKYLIEEGVDVNAVATINEGNQAGLSYESALDVAIFVGDLEGIKLLLANGANIEYMNESVDGNTPLLMAVMRNSTNIVAYLLEEGADSSYKNDNAETALDLAERLKHKEQVEVLNNV